MTDAQATKMALALAGTNSIDKLEATQYCKKHRIPFNEVRAHALRVAAEHDRRR
jgi:hypothetical protein